jgi:hypothetical protein
VQNNTHRTKPCQGENSWARRPQAGKAAPLYFWLTANPITALPTLRYCSSGPSRWPAPALASHRHRPRS